MYCLIHETEWEQKPLGSFPSVGKRQLEELFWSKHISLLWVSQFGLFIDFSLIISAFGPDMVNLFYNWFKWKHKHDKTLPHSNFLLRTDTTNCILFPLFHVKIFSDNTEIFLLSSVCFLCFFLNYICLILFKQNYFNDNKK